MGFRPSYPTETITVPADVLPYPAHGEPLRIVVRTNLTRKDLKRFAQYNRLPKPYTLEQSQALYAPFVVGWSYEGESPPAEGGRASSTCSRPMPRYGSSSGSPR